MGRPKVSEYDKFCRLQDYYLQVERMRHETIAKTGQKRSARQACTLIAERGGLAWVQGGQTVGPHVTRKSKQRLYDVNAQSGQFVHKENGSLYVERLAQDANSIESRYDEAARWYRRDRNVARAWDNMLADVTGAPRKPPLIRSGGRYQMTLNLSEYFVASKRAG